MRAENILRPLPLEVLEMKKINTIVCIVACLLLAGSSTHAQDKLYHNEFPLADVKLLQGPFQHARDLNIKVLLKYDVG